MPRRYFNWKLAAVLIIGILVLGLTAYSLRRWHRERRALSGLQAGNAAYEQHDWQQAAKHLGRYLAIEHSDVPVLLKYAEAQLNIRPLQMNNIQQAIAAYRTVLRNDKTEEEAAQKLAEIYLQMQMPGEAELIITRIPETKRSPSLQRLLAVILAAQRKFQESANVLKAIINQNPEQVMAYEVLGQLTEQHQEHFTQEPVIWFNEAVSNNPSSALAYIIRASFYLRNEEKAKALADIEQAQKLDLSDTATRLRLAQELINAGRLDNAETHLNEVQKYDPANHALWFTSAHLALKSQSTEKMFHVAETGLEKLSAQSWDFMPIAAELYIRCDRLKLAEDCISKMKEKDITPPTIAFLEGLLAQKKGRAYEAVKCWQQAIKLGNTSPSIPLAIALTLSELGDKQSAVRQLQSLISEQPNLFDARVAMAKLLAETGNWEDAEEHARVARQISPGNMEAAVLYMQIRTKLLTEKDIQNPAAWQSIEDELASFDEAARNKLPVMLLQAKLAMRRSQFDKAGDLLSDARQKYSGQIEIELAEVELLTTQGKSDDAILKLQKIIEAYPKSLKAVKQLAALFGADEQFQNCEDLINSAMARFDQPSDQCELGLLLADFYKKWGWEEKYYQLLTQLNQNLPPNIRTKRRLLGCEQVTGDSILAGRLIDEIKALEGENGWQWRYEQARVWSMADNYNEVCPKIISLLKENLFTNPDDQSSRVLLAATYERTGDLRLAASTYQEALNRSPGDIRIIIPVVTLLYKMNEFDRADQILRQVDSEKLSDYPELRKLELKSYLRRGQFHFATEILEDLAANDPNNLSVSMSLALLHIRQNRFEEANEILGELKTQEPNSLPVTAAQIELCLRRDKSDEAISLCDELVTKLNNASAYILRGKTFASLGINDKAQNDLHTATAIEPDNPRVWIAQSDFYRSTGQLDKAFTSIQKADSLIPENIEVKKRAILILLARGENDSVRSAENMLNEALASNPEDIELQLYKARLLIAENTTPAFEKAENIILNITENRPDLAESWVLLAEIALSRKQPTKALDIALRGLVYKPNDKSLLLVKARSEAARSPALSVHTLKALQELYPNDADVLLYLAKAYLDSGDSQKAVYLLEDNLDVFGNDADKRKITIAYAKALYKNGDRTQAAEQFESLYSSEPDNPGPLLMQAGLLSDEQLWGQLNELVARWLQNHPKDTQTPVLIAGPLIAARDSQAQQTAEQILRRTLQNNPDNTDVMNMLATLSQITGRLDEAAQLYRRILTTRPDNVIAINNLAWILCQQDGQYEQALELAQHGLKIAPDYIDLIDTRGIAYYRLGDLDNAVKDFNRCVEMYPEGSPSAATSYLHLGMTLEKLGQEDEAVKNLRRALELNATIGGLSAADFVEAQRLLKELAQKGV